MKLDTSYGKGSHLEADLVLGVHTNWNGLSCFEIFGSNEHGRHDIVAGAAVSIIGL